MYLTIILLTATVQIAQKKHIMPYKFDSKKVRWKTILHCHTQCAVESAQWYMLVNYIYIMYHHMYTLQVHAHYANYIQHIEIPHELSVFLIVLMQ